jgi:hypothetical protein
MSIVDKELPFALIDLIISVVQCFMGGIFMCMVSGYFALTLPPVLLVVWGKYLCTSSLPKPLVLTKFSDSKVLPPNLAASSSPGP